MLVSTLRAEDKPKEKTSAVASGWQALVKEYANALKKSDAIFKEAKTDKERQTIRADFHKWRVSCLDLVLGYAEASPKDKDALASLFFTLHPDTYAEERQVGKAVELILKDHITSDRLIDPPILQIMENSTAAEKLMRGVLEKNPHHAVQAQACLRLGQIVKGKSAAAPQQAATLAKEAESLFERTADKYADVKKVAEVAKAELFEMHHLAIGKVLPDIRGKDGDDKEFKLSDFRGKVVVLSFWAEWCLPCMKMVPQERLLVERTKDELFTLVGVNRNETRESLKKCQEKHNITWRSFFDSVEGPICTSHNIRRMPTTLVLDAKGAIRFMNVSGEDLDKAVDQLLAELKKDR
jgi:peroxiredoxin